MSIGNKIKEARKAKKMTQQQLADAIGVAKSSISKWEKDIHEPDIVQALKFAKVLEKPIEFFVPDDFVSEMRNVGGSTAYIPVIGEIACGAPILAVQNVEYYKEIPKDELPSGELFILKAKGDSMYPSIVDGDYVLIRLQPDVEDGEIAAVQVDNDTRATLKKVQHAGDNIVLLPINPEYSTIVLNENNPGRIIGRAMEVRREL